MTSQFLLRIRILKDGFMEEHQKCPSFILIHPHTASEMHFELLMSDEPDFLYKIEHNNLTHVLDMKLVVSDLFDEGYLNLM
jgi:hypothetical protein